MSTLQAAPTSPLHKMFLQDNATSSFYSELASLLSHGRTWWWAGLICNTFGRLALTVLAATLAISWYAWLIKKSTASLPPGPPGLPLLGNLPFVEPDLHRYFAKLSQTYGSIIKLQLGSKICIVISSASVAKEVLKEHDEIFANRDVPLAALKIAYGGVDIVWSPHGPEWRILRRILSREMMSNKSLDALYALRRQQIREMVKDFYGRLGSPVSISEEMFLTLLNTITNVLWGDSLRGDGTAAEFRQAVQEMVELLGMSNVSDVFPVLAPFDLQGIESKMKKVAMWVDRIFESLVAARVNSHDQAIGEAREENKKEKKAQDFLQALLEIGNDNETSLSKDQIKALLLDVVAGATDTSSTTLEWAMTELLYHPDKMRKAQEELLEVVGIQNIVEELHLPKLHYLDAVIKETFRLHPVVPLLVPRSPSKSCCVAGYTIPKGSRVLINAWQMQRDPEYWKNPLAFEPERFLEDPGKGDFRGNNFNFLPFGSGRRICAGIALGERLTKYVLATLLHSFEWKVPEDSKIDLSDKFGIVMKKAIPLVAIPSARLPSAGQYV